MAGEKRKQRGGGSGGGGDAKRLAKRLRYNPNMRSGEIRGPGIWFTCERRKEAKSVFEAYDLLNEVADRIYPETATGSASGQQQQVEDDDDEDVEESIEDSIAKELASIQPRGAQKNKMRFTSVKTNTECLVWIGCAPPCDPVVLASGVVENLQGGGPVRSKFLQRMTPVSATAHADIDSLKRIAYNTLGPVFAPAGYTLEQRDADTPIKYRIEPNLRNHTGSLNREKITEIIGTVVKDLSNPSFQFPKAAPKEETAGNAEPTGDDHNSKPEVQNVETEALDGEEDASKALEQDKADNQPEPQGEKAEASRIRVPREPLPAYRRRTFVDLKNATHTIMVTALKGVVGISIVQGYDEGKKFNIQTLGGGNQPDPRKEAEKAAKKEAEVAARAEMEAEAAYHAELAAKAQEGEMTGGPDVKMEEEGQTAGAPDQKLEEADLKREEANAKLGDADLKLEEADGNSM